MSEELEQHLRIVRDTLRGGAEPLRKSLGQHLLLDPGVLRRIVAAAGPLEGQRVLEIGAGPGTLTAALLEAGARPELIELDARWAAFLRRRFGDRVVLHEADAMAQDGAFLRQRLAADGEVVHLVANLPYGVASPVMVECARSLHPRARGVVTIQKEVAGRLVAPVGSRERGLLTLLVASRCTVRRLFDLAAGAFYPPPKVASCVVSLVPRDPPLAVDWAVVEELWRTAFQGRRKMLRSVLRRSHPALLERAECANLLERRAEELDESSWLRLAGALAASRDQDLGTEGGEGRT